MICHNNPIAFLARLKICRTMNSFVIYYCECCLVTELRWPKMPPITSPFRLCWKLRISKCLTMTSLAPCFTDPLTSSTPINAVVNEQVRAQEFFLNIWSISGRSFSNNRMVAPALGTLKVGSMELDWSLESIHDPWYGRLHPRAALTRAF